MRRATRGPAVLFLAVLALVAGTASVSAEDGTGAPTAIGAGSELGGPIPAGLLERGVRMRGGGVASSVGLPGPELVQRLLRQMAATSTDMAVEGDGVAIYEKVAPAVCLLARTRGDGMGSGCIIRADGRLWVLTNQHVANRPGEELFYFLKPESGTRIDPQNPSGRLRVHAVDVQNDLALLPLEGVPEDTATIELARWEDVKPGMRTWAIGHPQGILWSISEGSLSAIVQDIDVQYDDGLARRFSWALVNHTPIDPGSSGGPLLEGHGNLIGVNAMTKMGTQVSNYAIGVNVVRTFVDQAVSAPTPPPATDPTPSKPTPPGPTPDPPRPGPTPPPSQPTQDGQVLRVQNVYLSSVEDWNASEQATRTIDLKEFYLFTEFRVQPLLAVVGTSFRVLMRVEYQKPGTDTWVQAAVDDREYTADLEDEVVKVRSRFAWTSPVKNGAYRFTSVVLIGAYASTGSTTLTVN